MTDEEEQNIPWAQMICLTLIKLQNGNERFTDIMHTFLKILIVFTDVSAYICNCVQLLRTS